MRKHRFAYMGICFLFTILAACTSQKPEENLPVNQEEATSTKLESKEDIKVSFLAVGDNLIHGAVYVDPYHNTGDGWNYDSFYDPIKPYLEGVDVKNINQETPLGGRELGLAHYPQFNGPKEIGTAVVAAGFNWISQASNHAIDAGVDGIMNQMSIWDDYDEVISTGMNRTREEANELRIMEKQGLKIGLLNYTYGLNGLVLPQGKEYMVNMIDEDTIKSDIAKLKPECDVIVASMHWGNEYAYEPNEEQKALAQMLSDEGVRVIIGSHPHVIEPVEYITSKTGEKTLVYYSLGNFLSAQDGGDTMLGGMARFDLIKHGDTGEISVENAKFYPTVTHYNKAIQDFKTYALKDYTDDLAQAHYLSASISRQYFIDLTKQILKAPENIEIIY